MSTELHVWPSVSRRLHLPPAHDTRMRGIVAASVRVILGLRPEWYRARISRESRLRIFLGHLIVLTLEGRYVWLALDESTLSHRATRLRSWCWDEPATRPGDAAGPAYPRYHRPTSRNGFYDPSKDSEGLEWREIEAAHHALLRRAALEGRSPDPRSRSDAGLVEAIAAWTPYPMDTGPGGIDAPAVEVGRPLGDSTPLLGRGAIRTRVHEMPSPPSVAEYVRALTTLGERVTEQDRSLFRVHYEAPDRAATSTQIAGWVGVGGHYRVNLRYGKLGRAVCDILGIEPGLRSDETFRWWTVWSRGWKAPNGFVWQMLPQVAGALELLGWVTPRAGFTLPDEVAPSANLVEGAARQVTVNAYERSPEARTRCAAVHGTDCCICGFRFGAVYGEVAEGYIHVHHLRPLSEIGGSYEVDPVADLRPVCPNCHAVLHLGGVCRTIEEVRSLLRRR